MLGYMAENVLSGDCDIVAPGDLDGLIGDGWTLVDVRTEAEHAAGAIPGSVNIPRRLASGPPRRSRRPSPRRVLRGGPARPHRHRVDARAGYRGPQSRRRIPDLDRMGQIAGRTPGSVATEVLTSPGRTHRVPLGVW